jgi:hypothetical protein
MNVITHLCLSMKLKKIIEANLPVRINTLGFMFGNIKPDLIRKSKKVPHFKKSSEKYVIAQSQKLIKSQLFIYQSCPCSFSINLGVLTHYLADYFCYAHNEDYKGTMLNHYIYEIGLSINYYLHNNKISNFEYLQQSYTTNNIFSIFSNIDAMTKEYSNKLQEVSHVKDISFALKACSYFCFSIVSACLSEYENISITEEVLV